MFISKFKHNEIVKNLNNQLLTQKEETEKWKKYWKQACDSLAISCERNKQLQKQLKSPSVKEKKDSNNLKDTIPDNETEKYKKYYQQILNLLLKERSINSKKFNLDDFPIEKEYKQAIKSLWEISDNTKRIDTLHSSLIKDTEADRRLIFRDLILLIQKAIKINIIKNRKRSKIATAPETIFKDIIAGEIILYFKDKEYLNFVFGKDWKEYKYWENNKE